MSEQNDKLQGEREQFEAAWPKISKAGIDNGWRGVAEAAWQAALASDAEPVRGNKFVRAWINLNEFPGTMMSGPEGLYGPVPALTNCTITTNENDVRIWESRGDSVMQVFTTPPSTVQAVEAALPTEKELLDFAGAEELFLFADREDFLAIANGVLELVAKKMRPIPTEAAPATIRYLQTRYGIASANREGANNGNVD